MFDWEDILVVGDSFAAARDRTSTDWPKILACKLVPNDRQAITLGEGFPGCSWWSVRKYLLNTLKTINPKVLVITHTESMRLPSDENFSLNYLTVQKDAWFKRDNPSAPKAVREAAKQYFKYLQSREFHVWAQRSWYIELDNILDELKIPYVMHMHCFLPWFDEPIYEFRNGITFDTPLWEISDDIQEWSSDNRNHFSVENNNKLADSLYRSLMSYSNGMRSLNL